jgi:hypothetical protein
MEQNQYNGIERELKNINNKLGVLISLLRPLKEIAIDVEVSKVSLNKLLKQDKTPSIYNQQPKVMS